MSFLGRLPRGFLGARAELALATRSELLYDGDTYEPTSLPLVDAGSRVCGANGCTSIRSKSRRRRGRPIFEEDWGCSERCLDTLVRSAVRREGGGTDIHAGAPHRHRVPLGLVLLAQGWITHPQLQAALVTQKANGSGKIGHWLALECGLDEERITRGLSMQWGCAVLTPAGFTPSAMALVMPKRFVAEFGLVPLRVAGSRLLYLAFEDQMNAAVSFGIEQMSGLKVENGLLKATDFAAARKSLLAADGVPVTMASVSDTDELSERIVRTLERKQGIASRLVRVHQYYWLRVWLESGAKGGEGSLPSSTEDIEDHIFVVGRPPGTEQNP